jgi:hypothetical protein
MRPDKVTVLGIEYSIEYVDKPSEVDIFKRESLWGQIDYWTRSIRIYENGHSDEDVWGSLIHEVLHAIAESFNLKSLEYSKVDDEKHNELGLLALALTDVLFRNDWIKQ